MLLSNQPIECHHEKILLSLEYIVVVEFRHCRSSVITLYIFSFIFPVGAVYYEVMEVTVQYWIYVFMWLITHSHSFSENCTVFKFILHMYFYYSENWSVLLPILLES